MYYGHKYNWRVKKHIQFCGQAYSNEIYKHWQLVAYIIFGPYKSKPDIFAFFFWHICTPYQICYNQNIVSNTIMRWLFRRIGIYVWSLLYGRFLFFKKNFFILEFWFMFTFAKCIYFIFLRWYFFLYIYINIVHVELNIVYANH